jgi:hypothetical protein
MTKPMFSENRPLLTETELRDACLHAAATIVVAVELGCEFEDCRLTTTAPNGRRSSRASKSNTPKAGAKEERRFFRPSLQSMKRVARLSPSGAVAGLTASTIIPQSEPQTFSTSPGSGRRSRPWPSLSRERVDLRVVTAP